MEQNFFSVNIDGLKEALPIIKLVSGISIAFFNLHGNTKLTQHCGKALAKRLSGVDVLLTAESKGLQLAHVIACELGHEFYAVARKTKKLYMQDGLEVTIKSSITTGQTQSLYLSEHDKNLISGKNVAIVDDVVSTGNSLGGLEELVQKAGGRVAAKAFVLAEGDAAQRSDIVYLAKIPIL